MVIVMMRMMMMRMVMMMSRVQMQCHTGQGASLPGSWSHVAQPAISQRHVAAADTCEQPGHVEGEEELEPRQKRFKLNSFQDEWEDYDSWGVDLIGLEKRSGDASGGGEARRPEGGHLHHMGKRKLGSM